VLSTNAFRSLILYLSHQGHRQNPGSLVIPYLKPCACTCFSLSVAWLQHFTNSAYRKFEEWTKEYGPVFTLRQGFTTVIIVGRIQAAIDIMEKEGASTVDRPTSIAAGETLSGGMRVLLTPAGERFKRMRR
jgi:hypothetical protein